MNRGRALRLAALLAAVPAAGRAADVVLADDSIRAAFDSVSGALVRLESPATGWAIERSPELGLSFRLHAPLPGRRDNFVLGAHQAGARVERVSDREVRITWHDLRSEHGGVLPMDFVETVRLEHGELRFEAKLLNRGVARGARTTAPGRRACRAAALGGGAPGTLRTALRGDAGPGLAVRTWPRRPPSPPPC
jgi:hypothetical protein